jgi:hypothetical protein
MKTFTIVNGGMTGRLKFRQVVVAPDGTVRRVVKAVRSGHRHTIQEAFVGDLVFRESFMQDSVSVVSASGTPTRITNLAKEGLSWMTCPKILKAWLSEIGKEDYLPSGYGWDGQVTDGEMRKILTISKFFKGLDEDMLDRIVTVSKYSPKKGMPTEWSKVERGTLPKVLDVLDGKSCWVVWDFSNGVSMVSSLSRTSNLRGAAKLTLGAYENSNGPYGIAWELFRS